MNAAITEVPINPLLINSRPSTFDLFAREFRDQHFSINGLLLLRECYDHRQKSTFYGRYGAEDIAGVSIWLRPFAGFLRWCWWLNVMRSQFLHIHHGFLFHLLLQGAVAPGEFFRAGIVLTRAGLFNVFNNSNAASQQQVCEYRVDRKST